MKGGRRTAEPGYGKHLLAQSTDDKSAITLTLTREEAETALDILADGETGWPESSYWYGLVRSAVAKLRAALEGSEDE